MCSTREYPVGPVGIPLGTVGIITGALVLTGWIPLRERVGLGTILNVTIIGILIDVSLLLLPDEAGSIAWRGAAVAAVWVGWTVQDQSNYNSGRLFLTNLFYITVAKAPGRSSTRTSSSTSSATAASVTTRATSPCSPTR